MTKACRCSKPIKFRPMAMNQMTMELPHKVHLNENFLNFTVESLILPYSSWHKQGIETNLSCAEQINEIYRANSKNLSTSMLLGDGILLNQPCAMFAPWPPGVVLMTAGQGRLENNASRQHKAAAHCACRKYEHACPHPI